MLLRRRPLLDEARVAAVEAAKAAAMRTFRSPGLPTSTAVVPALRMAGPLEALPPDMLRLVNNGQTKHFFRSLHPYR